MPRAALHQLQPFNECRFDDCMAYLSAKHNRPLSTYELMKLHVMIDVYHTVDRAKPVIGGQFAPFPNGPVSRSAMGRVAHWYKRYEKFGEKPDGFDLIEDEHGFRVKPTRIPDEDDFSEAELSAMRKAWDTVVLTLDQGWEESQAFFHRTSFIGRVWKDAKIHGVSLDWNAILAEYDEDYNANASSRVGHLLTY